MLALLVEDEAPKREKLRAFLETLDEELVLIEAKSVRSAVQAIKARRPDIILLDMSLPTFDITENEPGGRPQGFGGKEIFKYLERFGLHCPTVVVTGYEAFLTEAQDSVSLEAMDEELQEKYGKNYKGLVYYNSLYSDWQSELKDKITEAVSTQ